MECDKADVDHDLVPGNTAENTDLKKERIVYDPSQLKELNKSSTSSPPNWLDLDSIPEPVKKGPKTDRITYERGFLKKLMKEGFVSNCVQSIPEELRKGAEYREKPKANARFISNRKNQELPGKKHPHWTYEQVAEIRPNKNRTRSISTGEKPKLNKAKNPWLPTSRFPELAKGLNKIEKSKRIAQRILNKLTTSNINQMRTEFQNTIQIDDETTKVVALIFYETALRCFDEIHFHWVADAASKMILLNGRPGCYTPALKKLADEIVELCVLYYEKSSRLRRLGIGNLLAMLYNKGLVDSTKIVDIINFLLATEVEDHYEHVCHLLKKAGEKLELELKSVENDSSSLTNTFHRISVDLIFNRFLELTNRSSLSSRIRFGLMDVIEMRDNGWKPRFDPNTLRILDEVRLAIIQTNLFDQLENEKQGRPRNGYTMEGQHELSSGGDVLEYDSDPSWRQDNTKRQTSPSSSGSEQAVPISTEAAGLLRKQTIQGNAGGSPRRASTGSSTQEVIETTSNYRKCTKRSIPPRFSKDASVHGNGNPTGSSVSEARPVSASNKGVGIHINGFNPNVPPPGYLGAISPVVSETPSTANNRSFGTQNISPRNNETVAVQSTKTENAGHPASNDNHDINPREPIDDSTQALCDKCARSSVPQAVTLIFDDYRSRKKSKSTFDCIRRSFGETAYFVSELARQACTMSRQDHLLAMNIIRVLLEEGQVTKSLVTQSLKIGITSQVEMFGVEVRADCLKVYLSDFLVEMYENEEDILELIQLRYGLDSMVQPPWDEFVTQTIGKLKIRKDQAQAAKTEEDARRVGVGIVSRPVILNPPALNIPSNTLNQAASFPLDQVSQGSNNNQYPRPGMPRGFAAPGNGYAERTHQTWPMVPPNMYHPQPGGFVPMIPMRMFRGPHPFGNSYAPRPQAQPWNTHAQSMLAVEQENRNGRTPNQYFWSRTQQQQNDTVMKQKKFIEDILQFSQTASRELANVTNWKDAVEIIQTKFPQFFVEEEIHMLTPENGTESQPTATDTMEILLSSQHYDITSVPTYKGGNRIGAFEITETGSQSNITQIAKIQHIWSRIGSDAKPTDSLPKLVEKHVAFHEQKQYHFLFWLTRDNNVQERIQKGFRKQSNFICISEHLEQILLTSILDKWELYATKVHGSIYLWNDASQDSIDTVLEGCYATNLANILTSKEPGAVSARKCYQVNEVSFGSHHLLVLVDAPARGDTGETYEVEAYKIDSVNLIVKQSKCWGRSIISGCQSLILGVLDKDGQVKTLDTLTSDHIQRKFHIPTSAYFELQDRLLKWINNHFKHAPTPMVKKFSWKSGTPSVVCTSVPANEVPAFFKTDFFTNERNC